MEDWVKIRRVDRGEGCRSKRSPAGSGSAGTRSAGVGGRRAVMYQLRARSRPKIDAALYNAIDVVRQPHGRPDPHGHAVRQTGPAAHGQGEHQAVGAGHPAAAPGDGDPLGCLDDVSTAVEPAPLAAAENGPPRGQDESWRPWSTRSVNTLRLESPTRCLMRKLPVGSPSGRRAPSRPVPHVARRAVPGPVQR